MVRRKGQVNPDLARPIERRIRYTSQNHAQVDLMRSSRAGELDDNGLQAVHLGINGLAAGLRNTG